MTQSGDNSNGNITPEQLVFRVHAVRRMFERRNVDDVQLVLLAGETIDDYPNDFPYPSRLVLEPVMNFLRTNSQSNGSRPGTSNVDGWLVQIWSERNLMVKVHNRL